MSTMKLTPTQRVLLSNVDLHGFIAHGQNATRTIVVLERRGFLEYAFHPTLLLRLYRVTDAGREARNRDGIVSPKLLKLEEIAQRIDAHLKRFEHDPMINERDARIGGVTKLFWKAQSYSNGRRVRVTYISYQHTSSLTKADALTYLAWLDAGNVGRHHTVIPRKTRRQEKGSAS